MTHHEDNVAAVLIIGINGEVISVKNANNEEVNSIPIKKAEMFIKEARKSTCTPIISYHLEINPCYIIITVGGRAYKIPVP